MSFLDPTGFVDGLCTAPVVETSLAEALVFADNVLYPGAPLGTELFREFLYMWQAYWSLSCSDDIRLRSTSSRNDAKKPLGYSDHVSYTNHVVYILPSYRKSVPCLTGPNEEVCLIFTFLGKPNISMGKLGQAN